MKGDVIMSLAMPNIKTLLAKIREKDWYITAFPFAFCGNEYAVVFEDLREVDRGTRYFAVCLTFIDINNENRRLETYVNAYRFNKSDEELIQFFGIVPQGRGNGNMIWQLYNALNDATPDEYRPIEPRYKDYAAETIDRRENNEGFCCYMARHNGKDSHGEQIYRFAKNTAKTRLLRETLYNLLGEDRTISFVIDKKMNLTMQQLFCHCSNQNKIIDNNGVINM